MGCRLDCGASRDPARCALRAAVVSPALLIEAHARVGARTVVEARNQGINKAKGVRVVPRSRRCACSLWSGSPRETRGELSHHGVR